MANITKLHVLLWSHRAQNFHRETLDQTIKVGSRSYVEDFRDQDYIVVGVSESHEELDRFRDQLTDLRDKKDAQQDGDGDA